MGLREDMGALRHLLSKTRRGKNYTGNDVAPLLSFFVQVVVDMMGVTGFIRFYELKRTQTGNSSVLRLADITFLHHTLRVRAVARGAIRLPPITQTLLKVTTIPELIIGTTQIAGGMDPIEVIGTIESTEKTTDGLEKTTQDIETKVTEGMERKITGGMEKQTTEGMEIMRVKGTTGGMRTTDITGNIESMNTTEVTVQLKLTFLDPSESRVGCTAIPVMHP